MKPVSLIHLSPTTARTLNAWDHEVRLHDSDGVGEYFISDYCLKKLKKQKIPFQVLKQYEESELPLRVCYPSHSYLFEPPDPDALHEVMAYAMSTRSGKKTTQVLYLGRTPSHHHEEGFVLDRPGGKRSYHWEIPAESKKVFDIRDKFTRIAKRIRDENTRVVLSFGSGGIRLFAHPSLMKFINLMGLRPYVDEIWGSSGGAIAGLPYSLGVDPSEIEQEGYHLYNERYSFRFSPSKFEVMKNLLSDTLFPSEDQMLKGFMDCQHALQGLLEKYLKIKKRKIKFFCVAYNLSKKRSEVLTPEKVDTKRYITPVVHTDPLDAVIASSSIPILYVPRKIKRGKAEDEYVDGGTTEEIPLISPYHKWTRDRLAGEEKREKLLILCVNLFPKVGSSFLFTNWILKKVPVFRLLELSATYADMIRQARIDEHKGILNRNPNVTLWEVYLPSTGGGIVDTKIIPKVINKAQHGFFKQLLELEEELKRKRK